MITYVERKFIRHSIDSAGKTISVDLVEIRGKSTDEKPAGGIENGSVFFEFDTGKPFFFDGETGQWIYPYGGGT